MTQQTKLNIFNSQTENVKFLDKVWKHLNRSINSAYVNDETHLVEINTKLMIQIYCAYSEALFSKILHTPYGLTMNEISQVKSQPNIVKSWKKCFELALKKVEGTASNHKPNAQQRVFKLIDLYIYDPSLLRNKIAHGQWKKALNSDNTKINTDLTSELESMNIVKLITYKEALKSLSLIIEDLIESPNKTHRRDYWVHIIDFEKKQETMANWTVSNKIKALKKKKSRVQIKIQKS